MRTAVKILAGLAGLLLLVVAGAYWYLSTLDVSEYRDDISEAVRNATGRELEIAGDLSLDVFPNPKLVVAEVSLSNVDWGSRPEFITIKRLEAEVSLVKILTGTVAVNRIAVFNPVLFLETDANGKGNWTFTGAEEKDGAGPGSASGVSVDVSNVEIRDARVTYLDGVKNTTRTLAIKELLVKSQGWRNPLDLELRGESDDGAFEVTGETGSIAALLANDLYRFDLIAKILTSEVAVAGAIKQPMDGRGVTAKLSLKSSSLSDLLKFFGVASAIQLPVQASAELRDDEGGYFADNLKLALGKSDLSGDLSYTTDKQRPSVTATLQSSLLDLDELSPGGGKTKSKRLIPADPLPVDALRSLDADASFNGKRVIVSGMEVSALTLNLVLRNGRLELKPGGALYGGELGGRINLDASAKRPRLEMELKGKQINLGALVNAANQSDIMSGGPTELSVKLDGTGESPRDIAASSSGLLLANIGPGKIHSSVVEKVGADALMQVVRAASGEGQSDYTGFECGVARFDISKGQAVAKRGIAVQNPRMNVVGSGTIDLGTEELDIAIKTEPREGAGLSTGAVGLGVQVSGTLASPQTSVDSLGVAKAGASAAAAVATGGLSLLGQALFSRATADDAPCDTALGVKKKTTQKTETTARPSSRSAEEGGGTSSSPTEALKGVGDAIKGLFGN